MSTPPLLELPSSSCIASVIMSLKRTVGVTASPFTLEEQKFRWPGEQWMISFQMPPMNNRGTAADWTSFGLSLEGTFGTFLMGDPSARMPRGVATGTPVVMGINQTGNTLITDGWEAGVNGILLKGDYIQLGTGASSKLHMVTQNVNSNGSGVATLTIVPALRSSPADNAPIVVSNPRGLFRLVDNTWSWSVNPGPIYRLSFEAQEVVSA